MTTFDFKLALLFPEAELYPLIESYFLHAEFNRIFIFPVEITHVLTEYLDAHQVDLATYTAIMCYASSMSLHELVDVIMDQDNEELLTAMDILSEKTKPYASAFRAMSLHEFFSTSNLRYIDSFRFYWTFFLGAAHSLPREVSGIVHSYLGSTTGACYDIIHSVSNNTYFFDKSSPLDMAALFADFAEHQYNSPLVHQMTIPYSGNASMVTLLLHILLENAPRCIFSLNQLWYMIESTSNKLMMLLPKYSTTFVDLKGIGIYKDAVGDFDNTVLAVTSVTKNTRFFSKIDNAVVNQLLGEDLSNAAITNIAYEFFVNSYSMYNIMSNSHLLTIPEFFGILKYMMDDNVELCDTDDIDLLLDLAKEHVDHMYDVYNKEPLPIKEINEFQRN